MDEAETVRTLLADSPVVDGHNDAPMVLRGLGFPMERLKSGLPEVMTDLPRLRTGGVGAQFWSVYVPSHLPEPEAVVATLEQVDAVHRMIAAHPDRLALACTARQARAVMAGGRIASLLGVEGGHSIAGSLGVLRVLARLGVRYLTLTHNDNTAWADSATDVPGVGGLDDVGRAVVAELNRIGVLVDLSHVAATTQHAALDVATAPVIFSHSATRALVDHPRNVADDVLSRLAGNGGVLQVTFVPGFVSSAVAAWDQELRSERDRLGLQADWPWPRFARPGEPAEVAAAEYQEALATWDSSADLDAWRVAHPWPSVGVGDVADHVEHAREVAGPEHVGLGGDYDGVDRQPPGLADVSTYPRLLEELGRRGWNRAELAALTGGNVLRVLHEAEQVAEEPLWPNPAESTGR